VPEQLLLYSKSQVNKAGRILRHFWLDDDPPDEAELHDAAEVLRNYRAAHQYPLTKAAMGLRSAVATEGCQAEVSQRLKRATTIVDKLVRHPNMGLVTMQDIAGCRAVLENVEELRHVQRRLRWGRRRRVADVYDYISEPAASGYRGVHVIVVYDDRLIECSSERSYSTNGR